MKIDRAAMLRAVPRYERDRQEQRMERAERMRRLSAQEPRFAEIDRELRMTGAAAVRAAVSGDPARVEEAIRQVAQKNLALQEERSALLGKLGYPGDYLNGGAICEACDDTGYKEGGALCSCLRRFYREEQLALLEEAVGRQDLRFSAFTREFFVDDINQTNDAPYRLRREQYERCERYAEELSVRRGNLLLEGPAGCGKSLLAVCIARRAIERELSVAYVSALDYVTQCDNERFRRDEESAAMIARCAQVDLLVLDDLGAEPAGSHNNAYFLTLLQQRENAGGSTVICSAVDTEGRNGLYAKYSASVASRLRGAFERIRISGADLRGRNRMF